MKKPYFENLSLNENLNEILNGVLRKKKAEQAEVLVIKRTTFVSRFSENQLTQSTLEENNHLGLRVIKKKRIGFASTNQLSEKAVEQASEKSLAIMRIASPLDDFVSLPSENNLINEFSYADPELIKFKPESLLFPLQKVFDKAANDKVKVSGSITQEITELGVANSLGIQKTASFTELSGSLIAEKNGQSGYESFIAHKKSQVDLLKIYQQATRWLEIEGPLQTISPGEYEVVLSPEATAELVDFLSYLGFSALALQEGRSFAKLGERMVSPLITVWDDGNDPLGMPLPFDFEGITRQRVSLIEKGIVKGVVYDSFTAFRENKKSTGHALPYPSSVGPLPLNLFLEPGQAKEEDLIDSTKRGIYITRFFYVNPMDPLKTIITGLTRNGTYLIENGKLTMPLKNLRFTQNILEALLSVEAVAREVKIKKPLVAYCSMPAIKLKKFKFNGVSEI